MRKIDSGWRDVDLNDWHVRHEFPCPAAGMALPMIEYDRGIAVGLVNYMPRDAAKPRGSDVASSYRAFATLAGPVKRDQLPFLTAEYDRRNWAMNLFPHNAAADALLDNENDFGRGWVSVSEERFAELLYAMRGRTVPDMFGYGVEWAKSEWLRLEPLGGRPEQPFPCADMSARRREYEPATSAPMRVKLPCLDVDLAVMDQDDRLALVVDYKRMGAVCDTAGTNARALASLTTVSGFNVPAFMTRYFGSASSGYRFETYPLNGTASCHLAYVLGVGGTAWELADAVAGHRWVRLTEGQWLNVLRVARDL